MSTNVLLPQKFLAAGINCGVRRYRPDLGVLISELPAVAAGVFTQSTCKAAPVLYSAQRLPATDIRAIITNSGQANAATGEQGVRDNLSMANAMANALGCDTAQILTASTGVIGQALAVDTITQAIPALLPNAVTSADKFALAILTTDLVPKACRQTLRLNEGEITITGIAKGSGMIHPNMATMLGYILTDAKLNCQQAQQLLQHSVDHSFNMISVDGETSTNDCVFLIANGASGIQPQDQAEFIMLQTAMQDVAVQLAKAIVRDGEGASKSIEVHVCHAETQDLAKRIARDLTTSPLIKSAVYGESPNWGRVLARLGMLQLPVESLQTCTIVFQGFPVFRAGEIVTLDQAALKEAMKADTIRLHIDLVHGQAQATAWGCDLSEAYVKINANYVS